MNTMTWQVVFFIVSLPHFIASSQVQYSVLEETKKGFLVGNVAEDLGLDSKQLIDRKLQIVSQNKCYFNISLGNGNLYVIERIDREELCGIKEICLLNLEILAENPVNVFHIKIEILDINDNFPSFSKAIFNIAIIENALPGTHFSLGKAHDPDLGINSVQSYTLTQNKHFKLGEKISQEGIKYPELLLDYALDREKHSMYDLILTASDGGDPVKIGTALIKIIIQDVNDNYPVFNQNIYRVSLNENLPVGYSVICLNATDKDEGSNAEITYSFSDKSAMDIFSLNSESGDITISGTLDFEVVQHYEIIAEAEDGSGLVTHCTIVVEVLDVNDNAPEILVKSLFTPISEDTLPGTLIALINVNDKDSGKNGDVTCKILEQLPFKLLPSTNSYYKLVTSSTLDREMFAAYNITVQAQDEGSPPLSSSNTIHLYISDVNDNPPRFDETDVIVYITEHNTPGISIHSVQASDPDKNENSQIMYSIVNKNYDNIPIASYISINSATGALYAQRSFDYEQMQDFQFQVMAKDGGSPSLSSNLTVRVCVIDTNDNAPKILYPPSDLEGTTLVELIPLYSEKDYLITKVIAVDADSGHNAWLSYHLSTNPDSSLLTIGQHTGEIKLARNLLDTDSLRQRIVVIVKDNGIPCLSASVTFTLAVAENFQHVFPEVVKQPNISEFSSNVTFYLVTAIASISVLFILTVGITIIAKCREASVPTALGTTNRPWYPQLSMNCPSQFSDVSLPFPYSYDVCVTLDSKQNEIAYLKPTQNVPTENLIDTEDLAHGNDSANDSFPSASLTQLIIKGFWIQNSMFPGKKICIQLFFN
uniref:Cadherin domain-containing protein n=1 Tax=Leptobrachium leishanense TaxID=445787 RepID=A0A8C5PI95_9ANUR